MAKALNNTYFYKPWSFLLFNYSCSFHIRKKWKNTGVGGEYKLCCTIKLRPGELGSSPLPFLFVLLSINEY